MFSRKADVPLSVHIPGPAEDRPSWSRVGVIAAVGFIVGVAWPRLAGVRLGPSVPEATVTTASAAAPHEDAPAATAAPTGSPTVPAVAATPAAPPSAPAPPSVTVGHGVVFACKSSDGDTMKGSECGSVGGLDGAVLPRLRKLAECPEAASAAGKVHFVVHLDFPRGGVGIELGKGHGVSAPDALLACARSDMTGMPLTGMAHENPRYSVAYSVTFGGGASGSASASASAAPSHSGGEAESGSTQVVWEVAIVRDAPKTGKVVARLQRGTELHLGAPKDGWYPVKYGDAFSSEGWVYRGAIGR